MSFDDPMYDNPLLTARRRRTNPDGSNTICCKQCGREVAKASRERMATVICYECDTGKPQPKTVPVVNGIPRPDLMDGTSQDELLDAIWEAERKGIITPEAGTIEAMMQQPRSIFNLLAGMFRAIGFPQQTKPEITGDIPYDDAQSTSKEIAKRKKRKSIFSANKGGPK